MIKSINIKKFTNKQSLVINDMTMVNVILSKNSTWLDKVLDHSLLNTFRFNETTSLQLLIDDDTRDRRIVISNFCYNIHYTEIAKYWDIVFRLSRSNNLQFLISTQSIDVLNYLEKDISKNYTDSLYGSDEDAEEIPLSLHRISMDNGKIVVTRYNAKDFVASIKYGLEIR
jgi:hypothetical protein